VQSQRPFDPVVTFRNSQGEAARGTLTSLQRRSLVMEIYNPYSIIQVSEVLNDLVIRTGERAIYQGKAVVVSLLNTGLMALVSVALIDEWSELKGIGADPARIREEAQHFVDGWVQRFQVGRGYMVAVAEIRTFLAEVSRWTDQADLSETLPRGDDGATTYLPSSPRR
jgi:extracellular factor (EF) 3-hydroxypalmitic acid methyl ester biosynthesis protein